MVGGGFAATRRSGSGTPFGRSDPDESVAPVSVETLDAPGSEAGRIDVPRPGETTVLELFATWCSTCASYMTTLRTVNEAVDAAFVSLTNEPVGVSVDRADVVDWWREHDGAWPVGLDDELALTTSLDAGSVPYTVVFDDAGRIAYADAGSMEASRLTAIIKNA